jgi:hypothetical protein
VIDEFASDARRIVLTHLQSIRMCVYETVEEAKMSGKPELPAQVLNHFFQVWARGSAFWSSCDEMQNMFYFRICFVFVSFCL